MKQENYEQPEIVCILLPSRFQTKPGGTNLPLVIQYDCLDMLRTVDFCCIFQRACILLVCCFSFGSQDFFRRQTMYLTQKSHHKTCYTTYGETAEQGSLLTSGSLQDREEKGSISNTEQKKRSTSAGCHASQCGQTSGTQHCTGDTANNQTSIF